MKFLIIGAGVIGTVYGWQLTCTGHEVTLLVRPEKKRVLQCDGIEIHCTDERTQPKSQVVTIFRPEFVETSSLQDSYDLILVCVKSNQLNTVLPFIAENAGQADILFFQHNWWGDEKIRQCLPASQYFFGLSHLISGWKTSNQIICTIFDEPGMATMLGEKDGRVSARLERTRIALARARLKPSVNPDILGWLMAHYVEYLGAVGAILEAGSVAKFVSNYHLLTNAVLATREALDVCMARGLNLQKSDAVSLRFFNLPSYFTVPLARYSYGRPNIRRFLDEGIAHNIDEFTAQYYDVLHEGYRLGIEMPHLENFEYHYATSAKYCAKALSSR